MSAVNPADPETWPRSGWCWRCGPTRRRIAPDEVSLLESCVEHLPQPEPAKQLTIDGRP